LTRSGAKDRSRDPEVIARWAAEFPQANAAIVADDAFMVLESDNEAELTRLLSEVGVKLPATFRQQARDNRPHWIFRRPAFDTSANPVKHGLFEVKGNNQYVVGFGSIHPSGAEYRIVEDHEPQEFPRDLWEALLEIRATAAGERTRLTGLVDLSVVGEMRFAVEGEPFNGSWDIFLDSEEMREKFCIPVDERHYSLVSLAAVFRMVAAGVKLLRYVPACFLPAFADVLRRRVLKFQNVPTVTTRP
jgi:hypothetical protein